MEEKHVYPTIAPRPKMATYKSTVWSNHDEDETGFVELVVLMLMFPGFCFLDSSSTDILVAVSGMVVGFLSTAGRGFNV